MRGRLGVDVGGTFTDVVISDRDTGELRRTKVLSAPEHAGAVIHEALTRLEAKPEELDLFIHATTLVTNLIIERRGAKVGLLTTRGFRDILEIGLSFRPDPYNLQWDKTPPLVDRPLRREVSERLAADGTVLEPLNATQLLSEVGELVKAGVDSIAIALLHSYANPDHERQARELIVETYRHIQVSISSDIDPQVREYERTTTTALNAYAMPAMRTYVETLQRDVRTPQGATFYMHSGGGVVPPERVVARPIELVSSGPSAGALGAAYLGRRLGLKDLITFDIGGTSCDVCLIEDGQLRERDQIEVEWGVPLRVRCIDVTSVGAGGGSIAWRDSGGALRVGPQSAGAHPGPACYGFGGTEVTVSDANLLLGMLDPERFLGGRIKLDLTAAKRVIGDLAKQFEMTPEEVAAGVRRIAIASMAQAVRTITVQKGIDPRGFSLLAFGGAGGQHAIEVAEEMEIQRVVFPPYASTFSAFGLLTADLRASERMAFLHVLPEGIDGAEDVFRELRRRAVLAIGAESGALTEQRFCHLRYFGQTHELAIAMPASGWSGVPGTFEEAHERMYGTRLGDPIEVVALGVTATVMLSPVSMPTMGTKSEPADVGVTSIHGVVGPVKTYSGPKLAPGSTIAGPSLLYEEDSTIYIPSGWTAQMGELGELVCNRV